MQNSSEIGSDSAPYRVGILPIPGFALMSYACTVEPLRAANLLSRKPLYDLVHFGEDALTRSSGAGSVERAHDIGSQVPLDMLLVVAGGDPFAVKDRAMFTWLKSLAARGVVVGGVSGGAVVLAKAGLMSGRRLAVHWEHAPLLCEQFPDVIIERRLYVIDRDRVTCGGGIAPLDLMYALIANHRGHLFARLVSDWFLHTEIRAATAPQRAGVAQRVGSHSPPVLDAITAMEDHIADPLTLQQLAMIAGVTSRHLGRLFVDNLGHSVMEYYKRMRLGVGMRLVRESAMSIADIADATGFANQGHFSNSYKERYGIRPLADRSGAMNAHV